jgi:hypothetical protein
MAKTQRKAARKSSFSTRKSATSAKATTKVGSKKTTKKSSKRSLSISRTAAGNLIQDMGGKIFSVTVDTRNTPNRVLTGRLTGPTKGTGRAVSNVRNLGMVRIYDMVEHAWKTIDLRNVTALRCNGTSYAVR